MRQLLGDARRERNLNERSLGLDCMTVVDRTSAAAAYDLLAEDYDALTSHHDYGLWVGMLNAQLERQGIPGRRLLDLGCGTGRSTAAWRDAGYEVVGADISARMLALARGRLPGVALYHADIRDLPPLGAFDVVSCLCDVVNYVPSDELVCALRAVAQLLAPGGLVVFDANTLHMYRSEFAATHVVVDDEHALLVWRGGVDGHFDPGEAATLTVEAFRRDADAETWRRVSSVHEQHHHPQSAIAAAVAMAGLALVDAFGHGFDAVPEWPLDEERHTKALYIARKRIAPGEEGR